MASSLVSGFDSLDDHLCVALDVAHPQQVEYAAEKHRHRNDRHQSELQPLKIREPADNRRRDDVAERLLMGISQRFEESDKSRDFVRLGKMLKILSKKTPGE